MVVRAGELNVSIPGCESSTFVIRGVLSKVFFNRPTYVPSYCYGRRSCSNLLRAFSRYPKIWSHSLSLTGLGTQTFENSVTSMQILDRRLSREFDAGAYQFFHPSKVDDFSTIDIETSILTPARRVGKDVPISFPT